MHFYYSIICIYMEENAFMSSGVRVGRLIGDHRKATVTEETTGYKQGLQHIMSERTARSTLKHY